MTLDELRDLWAERDARYAMRRRRSILIPLSLEEEAAVRAHREGEAERLAPPVRAIARTEVAMWRPPG